MGRSDGDKTTLCAPFSQQALDKDTNIPILLCVSLPYEIVNAQQRVWESFVNREIPLGLWPKHFASAVQLQMIYDELDSLRAKVESLQGENERLRKERSNRLRSSPIRDR